MFLKKSEFWKSLALGAFVAGPICSYAQTSDTNDNETNVELIRQMIDANQRSQIKTEGGTEVSVGGTGGGLHGNLESKVEIEDEKSATAPAIGIQGRIKYVPLQGNLHTDDLPDWYLWVHVANEHLYTGGLSGPPQDNDNVIYEFKPRWQKVRGPLTYGVEFGVVSQGRYDLNEIQLRPFVNYQINQACRAWGSLRFARQYINLNNNDPDYRYWQTQAGAACFVGAMSIVGLNYQGQHGLTFNDNDGAAFLSGEPVPHNAITAAGFETRISPFVHHRFGNELGLTLTWEHVGSNNISSIDYYQYQDRWDKVMAFFEYPIRRNFILYTELSYKDGHRTLASSNANPEAFGNSWNFNYTSRQIYSGFNYNF